MKARTIFTLVGALLLALPAVVSAAPPERGSLEAIADDAWNYAKARHLLFRAGFGGTPEEVTKLHALGLHKAVDFLVDYHNQPDVDIPLGPAVKVPDPVALRKLSQEERQKLLQQNRREDAQYMVDVRHWWVQRMVKSPRPLEEKLVLFWHGHFATEWRTVRNSHAMALQNQLIREHAAGNFGKLLHQIIYDAAMLRYLDNNRNVKAKPNENLAREIMELFAMGEGQGYTEDDVIQGARALTGYHFDPRTLQFRFVAQQHDTNEKVIFGKKGKWNGEQFVDLILAQPATARFISRKLFTYFVHDNPSEELINQLAGVLRDNKYELAPLLKTMFLSREFYSTRAMGTQIKSPAQFVVGTIRALQIKEPNAEGLARSMRAMNQDLFEPPNVKGWDGGQSWVNSVTLFARNNFAAILLAQGPQGRVGKPGRRPPARVKPGAGLPGGPLAKGIDFTATLKDQKLDTPEAMVEYFARSLFASPLTRERQAELVAFVGELPPAAQWDERKREVNAKISSLLILMMCMPEYQLT